MDRASWGLSMVEFVVLAAFAVILVAGIALGANLSALLLAGLALFVGHGLWRGHSPRALARMASQGLSQIGSLLVTFAIIGALTASWRAAGTIPLVTSLSTSVMSPSTLVPATFVLCGLMSMVTGSSFAAAATVGVVCMTIASTMGISPALMGGAILSGAFVGDRCSPLSSSAMLVASLTETDVADNVRRMARTALVPLVACLALYVALGASASSGAAVPSFHGAFARSFSLNPIVLAPVVVVLLLSLLGASVRATMLTSLGVALALCVLVQGVSPLQLPRILVLGYQNFDPQIARMVNGGGIASMLDVIAVVAVASTYSGIFQGTGLLDGLRAHVNRAARGTTPFLSVLATSLLTCMVSCDQVVALMLTHQLCGQTERNGSALALDLENSAEVLPMVIPWSTSVVGIGAFVGMPVASCAFAFLGWLIPAWALAVSIWQHRHPRFSLTPQAHALGLDARDDVRLAA